MTDAEFEVARIRAEFAARDSVWMGAIAQAIAQHGPRITAELIHACGIQGKHGRSLFSTFLSNQKVRGRLVVVDTRNGHTGVPNNEWGMPS